MTPNERRRKFIEQMNAACEAAAPAILEQVINFAKAGDTRAADMVMRRALPERQGAFIDVELPPIKKASDIVDALSSVTVALGEGRVTTTEAVALCQLFEYHRKAIETTDLDVRLKRMEAVTPAFNPTGTDD